MSLSNPSNIRPAIEAAKTLHLYFLLLDPYYSHITLNYRIICGKLQQNCTVKKKVKTFSPLDPDYSLITLT